jgi:hypothetical protein
MRRVALIGALLSYGWLYALTPVRLILIAVSLLAALALPVAGGRRVAHDSAP